MRIAIDASTISTQGGPRTYVLGLLDALLRIDRENDYVVFYNDECHLGRFPRAKEVVLPGKSPWQGYGVSTCCSLLPVEGNG